MKTKEELDALKEEVETLNAKLTELTEDELSQVVGGLIPIPYVGAIKEKIVPAATDICAMPDRKSDQAEIVRLIQEAERIEEK